MLEPDEMGRERAFPGQGTTTEIGKSGPRAFECDPCEADHVEGPLVQHGHGSPREVHRAGSPSPRITIFAVATSVGHAIELRPAATATFCEPFAM